MSGARKLAVVAVALMLCAVLTIAATDDQTAVDTRVTTPSTTRPVMYEP